MAPCRLRLGARLAWSAAAVLAVAGLVNTTWWTGRLQKGSVDLKFRASLWRRTYEGTAGPAHGMPTNASNTDEGERSQGDACFNSDECVEGTWCRAGEQRCWSENLCPWAYEEGRDCTPLVSLATDQTWTEFCAAQPRYSFDHRETACSSVVALRWLLGFTACLVAIASILVLCRPQLALTIGSLGSTFAVVSLCVAPNAAMNGSVRYGPLSLATGLDAGFLLQVLSLFCALAANAVTLTSLALAHFRWRAEMDTLRLKDHPNQSDDLRSSKEVTLPPPMLLGATTDAKLGGVTV